jgi:FkbM family methyltransferase
MPIANPLRAVRTWRSNRRLTRYLRSDPRAKTIVDFRGCRFFAGLDNKIEASLLRGGHHYDRANFAVVTHFVKPGHVCFDIGANIGVYSMVLARITGSAQNVHAFEPVDHIRGRFIANAKLNDATAINLNDLALGARPGSLDMFQIKPGHFRGGTSTFLRNDSVSALGEDEFVTRPVQVTTLDAYAGKAGLQRIDFLKIDVEGFELQVLEGAAEVISRFAPTMLLEYDESRLRKQDHCDRLRDVLCAHDYQVFEFTAFKDRLALLPFVFAHQPRGRNILCLKPAAAS